MNEETLENEVTAIVAEVAAQPVDEAAHTVADDARVTDLERRIRDLEAAVGDLRSVSAQAAAAGRRTHGVHTPRLLAKGAEPVATGSVDAALGSLSVEQRLAVKAGLLHAGLL